MDWESATLREAYFVFLAVLLAFGTLQVLGTGFATEKPVVSVVSCSMYPSYGIGDVLMVRGAEYSDLEEGDVIVYDAPESGRNIPIVHRIVEKGNGTVSTKGDNNDRQYLFEQEIEMEQVHGKVAFRIPRIGLVKILGVDLAGLEGAPLSIDGKYTCRERA